jgi:hypothetical protein
MRAARVLFVVALLVAGVSATAMAQGRITAPGVYPAKVGVVPGALPDGGASLPLELQGAGPDLYVGEVTISPSGPNFEVEFHGERADGAKLNASAIFSSSWTGLLLGNLVVGSSMESDVIVSINVASMMSGFINGVGTLDGVNQRVLAWLGPNGVVERFKILKAPGPFRR